MWGQVVNPGPALILVAALAMSVLVAPGRAAQRSENGTRFHVRIAAADVAAVEAGLERDGYDVLGTDREASTVDVAVSLAEWRTLAARGYRGGVVDTGRPLRDILQPRNRRIVRASSAAPVVAADLIPANYRDLDGIIGRMQEIAAAHPAIAQVVDITALHETPATYEGRHLFALKISDNVTADEDEPAVLIVGTHHGREIVAPVVTLGAAERLTAGYQTDARIRSAVNTHEIWIAPVWNPDGYNYVFTTDNLWRKNRRVFASGVGVDQNRNYSQGWSGSCAGSTSVTTETYKGPSAASEAETQTMMTWSQRERFAKVIDYHSSGREVLYAYNCSSHPFAMWMRQEATALSQASGYDGVTRPPGAEGEHQEWQFAHMGAYAFLIETHNQFQPSYDSALAEATRVWPGILTVLERPISVSGHVTAARSGLPLSARIALVNVAFPNGESNASGGPRGGYHMFLPPGTYDVRFSAPGYVPSTRQVTVTASSATVLDVQLGAVPASVPPPGFRTVH